MNNAVMLRRAAGPDVRLARAAARHPARLPAGNLSYKSTAERLVLGAAVLRPGAGARA